MKRVKTIWKVFLAIIIIIMGMLILIPVSAKNSKPLRCLIFYSNVKGVNSMIAQAAQKMETELDGDDDIWLSVYELGEESYSSFETKADIAIELDADVLILSGSAIERETDFQKLEENQIKLILVDGDMKESGRCAYVGTDNQKAGQQGADLLEKRFEDCAIGILSSSVNQENLNKSREERREGFGKRIEMLYSDFGENMKIDTELQCSLNSEKAVESIKDMIQTHHEINVLFCLDSASGIAAARAVKDMGKKEEIYIICFDMTTQVEKEIEEGGIDAVLVQNVDECAKGCIKILRELYQNPDSVKDRQDMFECNIITVD